jgi:hypothetical protein
MAESDLSALALALARLHVARLGAPALQCGAVLAACSEDVAGLRGRWPRKASRWHVQWRRCSALLQYGAVYAVALAGRAAARLGQAEAENRAVAAIEGAWTACLLLVGVELAARVCAAWDYAQQRGARDGAVAAALALSARAQRRVEFEPAPGPAPALDPDPDPDQDPELEPELALEAEAQAQAQPRADPEPERERPPAQLLLGPGPAGAPAPAPAPAWLRRWEALVRGAAAAPPRRASLLRPRARRAGASAETLRWHIETLAFCVEFRRVAPHYRVPRAVAARYERWIAECSGCVEAALAPARARADE